MVNIVGSKKIIKASTHVHANSYIVTTKASNEGFTDKDNVELDGLQKPLTTINRILHKSLCEVKQHIRITGTTKRNQGRRRIARTITRKQARRRKQQTPITSYLQ